MAARSNGWSSQGWPNQFDPVLTACSRQSFRLLWGWGTGGIRQAVAFNWTAMSANKALELPPARDGQKVRTFGSFDPVGVWRALRNQQDVARPGHPLPITNFEPHVACENLEHLIFALVHVKRRRVARGGAVFQDGDVIGSILIRHADQYRRVQKPEIAWIAGRGIVIRHARILT